MHYMLVPLRMVAGMPGERLNMLSSVQILIYIINVQVSFSTTINLIFRVWFY